MKRIFLLIITMIATLSAHSQALLFETFSQGIPSTWTLFNDDNTPHNPDYTDAWTVSPIYGNPAPGVVSTSWFTSPNDADRWIVSSPVLIASEGYSFVVEAAAINGLYADGLEIRVSTTGAEDRSHFSDPLLAEPTCDTLFCDYVVSLDDYVGDTVWIALVQNSYDMNLLMADNFRVCRPLDTEMELTSLLLPDSVDVNMRFPLSGVLTNKSFAPFSGRIRYGYTINGQPHQGDTLTIDGLAHGSSLVFTAPDSISLTDTLNRISLTIYLADAADYDGNNTLSMAVNGYGEVVGINGQPALPSLLLYPNPASQQVTLVCDSEIEEVRIFDLRGRLVGRSTDVSALPAGLYLLQARTQMGIITTKFSKQ